MGWQSFPGIVISAVTLVVAASDSLNPERADYQCDGTADEVQIQEALDALPAAGGEVKLLDGTYTITAAITLDSNQKLKGCGKATKIQTSSAIDMITATGGSGSEKTGIEISNLFLDGTTNAVNCIYFTFVDKSIIRNVWAQGPTDAIIYLVTSDFNIITENILGATEWVEIYLSTCVFCIVANNICHPATKGIGLEGILVEESSYCAISGNKVYECDMGITISVPSAPCSVSANIIYDIFTYPILLSGASHCVVKGNMVGTVTGSGGHGISVSGASHFALIMGNNVKRVARNGILISGSNDARVLGNVITETSQETDDTYDGINLISADRCTISENTIRQGAEANQPKYGINISGPTCDNNIVKGNDLYDSGKTANLNDVGTLTEVHDSNTGIEITQVRKLVRAKNTSGGQLVDGDVVVLKAVAAGNEITTTTSQGDDLVYGQVVETIADNAFGHVLVKGKTTTLKVNGTVDIAIGDPLGTFTAVKIAMKAGAGDQAFAIALEAYATDDSNGVIDAYIKSPWD